MKVLVVGGSGMLGTALVSVLSKVDVELYATYRTPWGGAPPGDVKKWFMFHSGKALLPSIDLGDGDWIVNAAGAIPQRPGEINAPGDMVRANGLLPYELAEVCKRTGARMIHVTTDCVFSGASRGKTRLNRYEEHDAHDGRSFYGRTKSMGENVDDARVINLRCSIIGPEPRGRTASLLGWFLAASAQHKTVNGYGDHLWNGVTTLALSKVISALVANPEAAEVMPTLQHLVPDGYLSKAGLLRLFARQFDRPQIEINVVNVGGIDRTLGTHRPKINNKLWELAGYAKPPTIEEMVMELANWVGAGNYPFFRKPAQGFRSCDTKGGAK